jgi:hypothetical protein
VCIILTVISVLSVSAKPAGKDGHFYGTAVTLQGHGSTARAFL